MNEYILLSKIALKIPITSITPFTLQDFPGKTACILWFSGCNFACDYCHNPELVKGRLKKLPFDKINTFLLARKHLLDGVVLCGGECTLSPKLPKFIQYIRSLGYAIKLDTNGSNPSMIQQLLAQNLIDYVAIDYKAPKEKYMAITKHNSYQQFYHSMQLLCAAKIQMEVRTTVHTNLLNEDDINNILIELKQLNYTGPYYVQNFTQGKTLTPLPAQERLLTLNKLQIPSTLQLFLRNF